MPENIGRYEIRAELGRGGMATVYRAFDPRFKREVALKVLPLQFMHDPQFRARFEREAEVIAALEHPAIVPVHDFGEDNGQPFIVMKLMKGGSLADRLEKGPISLAEAARLFSRIAPALDRAHARGIVHRDLKPGNILFDEDDNPYISDFGIAKLAEGSQAFTSTGGIVGTPAYMSPEQARGERNIDGRSDIYALGAIVFEMLTGKLPYDADTPMGVAVKHITDPIPAIRPLRPDLPKNIETLIQTAMAKKPLERYGDVETMAQTLTTMAGPGEKLPPRPASPQPPVKLPTPAPQPVTNDYRPTLGPEAPRPAPRRAVGLIAIIGLLCGILVVGGTAITAAMMLINQKTATPPPIAAADTATPDSEAATPTVAPRPTDTATAVVAVPPSGKITLWYGYAPGGEEQALLQLLDKAQAIYPELQIEATRQPFDGFANMYRAEVDAGRGPTLFIVPNDDLGPLARDGYLLNLDAQLQGKLDSYSDAAVEGMRVDGRLYGVPESAKVVALFYNRKYLTSAPGTTDALLDLVRRKVSLSIPLNTYHIFGFYGAFGGTLLDDSGQCVLDQTGGAEAFQYLLDLKDAGATLEPDYGLAEQAFVAGEGAMFINGSWSLALYKDILGDDLRVAPLPEGPNGPALPLVGIDGFYINPRTTSDEQNAAIELALYLTSADSAQVFAAVGGHIPIRTDVKVSDPLINSFAVASAQAMPRPQSREFGNYWGPFTDLVNNLFLDGQPVSPALAEACQAMNKANGK